MYRVNETPPCARRRRFLLSSTLALCTGVGLTWASISVLRIGLVPIFSPRTLIGLYQPLRSYLQQHSKRTIVLETAPDFHAFYESLASGIYDLALIPPHLMRLVQQKYGWLPLAIYSAPNRAYLIMSRARPVHNLDELRGQRLAVFDPLALNVMITLTWLRNRGYVAGRDFEVADTPGHASVAYAVVSGAARLGVTAKAAQRLLPPELSEAIAIFAEMPPIPSLVWAANPRLAAEAETLRALLIAFPDSVEGRRFFASTPYGGIRRLKPGELEAMQPYLPELIERLGRNP